MQPFLELKEPEILLKPPNFLESPNLNYIQILERRRYIALPRQLQKFIIFNTKFIIFNTKFLVLDKTFLVFDTKIIILLTELRRAAHIQSTNHHLKCKIIVFKCKIII